MRHPPSIPFFRSSVGGLGPSQIEKTAMIPLCYKAAPPRLFRIFARPETDQEFVWVYRCEAEGPFVLHPEEIERGDVVGRGLVDAAMPIVLGAVAQEIAV